MQVFGVPDAKYSEEVCVGDRPPRAGDRRAGDPRLLQGEIAHFKVPRYVRIVEQFPLTATGKPQKFEMRKAMIEQLGLRTERTA